ncbi:hypothetical protein BH23VER1_BH23VER1_09830 [soil metagenome]
MKALTCLALALSLPSLFSGVSAAEEKDGGWVSLFNGKDLEGWTPKIRHEKSGEDQRETFRVADGVIQVRYDNYTAFDETFGHLFYKTPFSHYKLRLEYRFVGEQMDGGPGWALRNSGIMIHGQEPETMAVDQDFPVSIEVQLLGGPGGDAQRSTANLCTPGTHVTMDGELVTRHCTTSTSKTYSGDQWVTVEVEVHGNEIITHRIKGETVLEYEKPVLDPSDSSAEPLVKERGGEVALSGGTISLQSESHPCDFRKIEILELEP